MEKDVKQRFKLNRGTLNIASMPFATHAVLPEVMHDFAQQHPNISFSIHDITNEKIIEKVQEGIFEIGICFEPKANDQLIFQPLFNEDFLALLPKHHVLAKQKSVTWLELCSCPFVTLQNPSIIRHVIEETLCCASSGVGFESRMPPNQFAFTLCCLRYGRAVLFHDISKNSSILKKMCWLKLRTIKRNSRWALFIRKIMNCLTCRPNLLKPHFGIISKPKFSLSAKRN